MSTPFCEVFLSYILTSCFTASGRWARACYAQYRPRDERPEAWQKGQDAHPCLSCKYMYFSVIIFGYPSITLDWPMSSNRRHVSYLIGSWVCVCELVVVIIFFLFFSVEKLVSLSRSFASDLFRASIV